MRAKQDTRQKLLDEGLQLAMEKGLRGLVVREIATRAGVNLGSFVYHFRNRETFIEELVELWYAPMYAQLRHIADPGRDGTAMQRLRSTLEHLIDLLHAHAGFIRHLVGDAAAGESAAQTFLRGLPARHPKLLLALVQQAQEEGAIAEAHPGAVLAFIMASVGGPLISAHGVLAQAPWLSAETVAVGRLMLDPAMARQRLDWVLKGLART